LRHAGQPPGDANEGGDVAGPGAGLTPDVPRRRSGRHLLEVAPPRLPFDVAEAKLRVPALRPDAVSRTALVNRLRVSSAPVVSCVSPAGYGKTTLLSQWASRDARPFAWVSIDERDRDPVVLLRSVAAALDRVEPLPDPVLRALHAPRGSVWTSAVPRLASAFGARRRPVVLVLDDADLLQGESAKVVATVVEHVPKGSTLVVTGRVPPRLRVARLRARGDVLEIATEDLALAARDVKLLLQQSADVDAYGIDADELVQRTEGWPVGVYLAALAFEHGRDAGTAEALRGDERYLAEYFESEYLAQLAPRQRAFLRRSSVLEHMTGPLCDAVLDRRGSARELALIDRANLFLVPLDGRGAWYRYQRQFREFLQRELVEREPELVPTLHRRAADWLVANEKVEDALQHAFACGNVDRAARILTQILMPAYGSGRIAEVESWLAWFDDEAVLERFPGVAVHGSRIHALRGRAADAERWLAAAERRLARTRRSRGSTLVAGAAAAVRALTCREGSVRMRAEAEAALATLPPGNRWRAAASFSRAVSLVLAGDDGADAALAEAANLAGRQGSTELVVLALSERALLAAEAGDASAADALAEQAESVVEERRLDGYAANALRLVVSARAKLRAGKWERARSDLEASRGLLERTDAVPWLAAQTRLGLAQVYAAMRDAVEARELVAEAARILEAAPGFTVPARECAKLAAELDAAQPAANGKSSSGLTDAELRLLPLLATHLSFREIGERLFVSRNTIKTQAISVYRKLSVSSRSDAVDRVTELGLLNDAGNGGG
jgi:LuxR family transcriptional regulator, maltose regulon positive regulatory protein